MQQTMWIRIRRSLAIAAEEALRQAGLPAAANVIRFYLNLAAHPRADELRGQATDWLHPTNPFAAVYQDDVVRQGESGVEVMWWKILENEVMDAASPSDPGNSAVNAEDNDEKEEHEHDDDDDGHDEDTGDNRKDDLAQSDDDPNYAGLRRQFLAKVKDRVDLVRRFGTNPAHSSQVQETVRWVLSVIDGAHGGMPFILAPAEENPQGVIVNNIAGDLAYAWDELHYSPTGGAGALRHVGAPQPSGSPAPAAEQKADDSALLTKVAGSEAAVETPNPDHSAHEALVAAQEAVTRESDVVGAAAPTSHLNNDTGVTRAGGDAGDQPTNSASK